MTIMRNVGRIVSSLLALFPIVAISTAFAGEAPKPRDGLKEPVLREVKLTTPNPNKHPLDQALDLARYGRDKIDSTIKDYTCTLVKRERVDGELLDYEYIFAKIRNPQVENGKVTQPFAVYMYFLKPTGVKGREVIYVQGKNNDKLVAHEGGKGGAWLPTVWLKPTGILAMRGQRYPIYDVGLKNLVLKLIEVGEHDKARGRSNFDVTFRKGAKINGRVCTVLEIRSLKPDPTRKPSDFSLAQIFIDDELQLPIRYAAYDHPAKPGEKPPLLEEYTYLNLKLNVGLSDDDFNHENLKYKF